MKKFPLRLVFGLIILVLVAVFASLNLQRVNVSIGIYVFQDVPLVLALIFAYIAGALCVLPFALARRRLRAGGGGEPREPAGGRSPRA